MSQAVITETLTQNEQQKKAIPEISRKEAEAILLSGAIFSLLYTICFNDVETLPHLSFALFCPAVLAGLTFVLKYLGYYKNKNAVVWTVPILILSVFNGLFSLNIFTYGNVILMHLLFAVYTASAMREQPFDLYSLQSPLMLIRTILGNFLFIFDIFKALSGTGKAKNNAGVIKKVLIGVLIALPVLFLIMALLLSADMVFDKIAGDIIYELFDFEMINISFFVTLVLAFAYATGYVFQSKKISERDNRINIRIIRADVVIGATFLALVNLVFLLFTFIQIAYLFGGGFMELPEGMVYSQYAREGFFQLLFVTVINFSVIFIFMNLLSGVKESKPLRFLLLTLCFFTGVLIASSFYRMYLYIEVYGHTTLRLYVITFLTMEVFLIAITVYKLFNDKLHYLKWFILTAAAFYFIVNITGSDYFSAKLNVNSFLSGKHEYVDVLDIEEDGLRVIKPLFEDDKYICVGNKIRVKSDEIDYANAKIQSYEDIVKRKFINADRWQNWTFFGIR